MLNVLVTGSSGQIGRYVVRELVQAGHRVTGVDIAPPPGERASYMRVDLTDAGDVYQSLVYSGAEAVVTWAHGPMPAAPDHASTVTMSPHTTFSKPAPTSASARHQRIERTGVRLRCAAHYVPVDEDHGDAFLRLQDSERVRRETISSPTA